MNQDKKVRLLAFLICILYAICFAAAVECYLYSVSAANKTIIEEPKWTIGDVIYNDSPKDVPVRDISVDPIEQPVETVVEPAYGRFNVPLEDELQSYIFEQCIEKNVAPELIFAMIYVESSYRPSAMGDGGQSYGLMQIQPRWHQERIDRLGCTDLLDPYQNVKVGIDYMSDLIGRKGSVEWALMAYNSGPSIANKKVKAGEITSYVTKVFEKRDKLLEEYM